MSEKKYLLRKSTGDIFAETEQEVRNWFQKGQCKPADFLFDFSEQKWLRVGDLASLADLMGSKPAKSPEKRLVYFISPGTVPTLSGPFSLKEVQQKILAKELSEAVWVFVDGDKEWRNLRSIKVLLDMLPPLPIEKPSLPSVSGLRAAPEGPPPAFSLDAGIKEQSNPSIHLDLGEDAPPVSEGPSEVAEQEDPTMAFSTLGLSLKVDHSQSEASPSPEISIPSMPAMVAPPPLPSPGAASTPPAPPPKIVAAPKGLQPAKNDTDQGSFDGITAEIPVEPIWLIKKANSEAVSGPFRFLDVMKFLEEGRINKNDKISKVGSNRFVKVQQQYEFNVRYTVETVVEHGVEKQKILIKRRHPRVPYFTGVQVLTKGGLVAANCVNISAGGILMEIAKAEFNLGDILEVKILPGLINRSISCKSLVIGKIPKIPPAYALMFEDLKNEDKEAIEFYVQETLKREMSKNS